MAKFNKDFETDPFVVKRKRLKKLLRCDICKPHRNENATKKARPDKYKNKRRS